MFTKATLLLVGILVFATTGQGQAVEETTYPSAEQFSNTRFS